MLSDRYYTTADDLHPAIAFSHGAITVTPIRLRENTLSHERHADDNQREQTIDLAKLSEPVSCTAFPIAHTRLREQ
jgi:hypothetical protein